VLRLLSKASDYMHRKHVGNLALVLGSRQAVVKYQTLPEPHERAFARELDINGADKQSAAWSAEERKLLEGVPCYVALPDYEFCYRILPSAKLPEKKSSAMQFIKWRLEQDLGELQHDCEVAIGQPDSDARSALMLKSNRYQEVSNLVRSASAQPKMLLPLGFYILSELQRSPESLSSLLSNRVLIFLWDDFWSFLSVNANGAITHYRSCRWSAKLTRAEEINELAAEFGFSIRAASGVALLAGLGALCELYQKEAELERYSVSMIERFVFGENEQLQQRNEILDVILRYET
jgi:hypothetical protein